MESDQSQAGYSNAPLGLQAINKCCPCVNTSQSKREHGHRFLVLALTFLAYCAYHTARRPLSVVKNVLNDHCPAETVGNITNESHEDCTGWEPFNGNNANQLLGYLDSSFLFAYALCMFLSGIVAERLNLRIFLSVGMVLTGIFTLMFGLAKIYNIHSYAYFVFVQIAAGLMQSTGFPSVVACVGNWFGKSRRGVIFGAWNSHTYIGNMLGAYIGGVYVEYNWAYSFIVPGLFIAGVGVLIFLFLAPYPEDIHCTVPSHEPPPTPRNETMPLMKSSPSAVSLGESNKDAITFIGALKIPGVLEFSVGLFFSKLVCYTFMFWLPMYIDFKTQIGSQGSAYLSLPFDIGGIIGGILAGFIADQTGASAITCTGFLITSIPMMFIYDSFGSISTASNIVLQVICGAFVNGPYALITTAVAAELGTHKTIRENSKALATVTAVIDGTGSIGGAVGPLLAGVVSETGWENVFYMMMISTALAVLSLMRVAYREGNRIFRRKGYCCYS